MNVRPRRRWVAAAFCLFALCLPGAAAAQSGSDPSAEAGGAPLPANASLVRDAAGAAVIRARRVTEPLTIDGRLDEAVYGQTPAITDFIQQEPASGAPISERTEVWVFFDDEHVYFACRCADERPERIVSNEMRRDNQNQRFHDNFGVVLDTFHDRRNGYLFTLTPIGGFTDATITGEGSFNRDWNTVWQNKAARYEGGWIAEMAIPFKSLRYDSGQTQTWGVNIRRVIRSKNEYGYVVPMDPAWGTSQAFLRVSAAATLVGLEAPPAARNVEIKPYAISTLTTDRLSRPAINNALDGDAGFDARVGVTKGITADFTYNTDFAQVEDDEAQVNLTRFGITFPEKREFFLEGQGVFTVAGSGGLAPSLFYSRRIGLIGTSAVPIIGGARLTGKAGGWDIGAMSITSDDVPEIGAAQTTFNVLRVRRDIFSRSTIGALFTQRSVSAAAPSGGNQLYGLDANFSVSRNAQLTGFVARTRTEGLRGDDYSYRTQFEYAGDRYGVLLDRVAVEDDFNPEVGFLRRQDFRASSAGFRFSPRPALGGAVRQYHFESGFEYVTDTSNRLESREVRQSFRTDLQSGDQFGVSYARSRESLVRPFEIARGVFVPVGGHTFDSVQANYNPGPQHRVSGSYSLEVGSFYTGRKTTAAARGRFEASTRLTFEPNISLNWVDLPEGRFTNTVVGTRGTFTVTPRAFVAALVQYASSTSSLSTNIRLRWEYHPGSELFVVYSEGRDTLAPRATPLENRGVAIKLTRLFRF